MFAVGAGVAWVCAGETRLAKGLAVALGEIFGEGDGAVVELGDESLGRVGTRGLVARGWPAVVIGIRLTPALVLARGMNVGCRCMREDARR